MNKNFKRQSRNNKKKTECSRLRTNRIIRIEKNGIRKSEKQNTKQNLKNVLELQKVFPHRFQNDEAFESNDKHVCEPSYGMKFFDDGRSFQSHHRFYRECLLFLVFICGRIGNRISHIDKQPNQF